MENRDKKTVYLIRKRAWKYSDINYWTNPEDNTVNATIIYKDKLTRLRAGMLIIKGDEILLGEEETEPGVFSLPGGGFEQGESPADAAEREVNEEVLMNVKNIRDTEIDYCECHTELLPWVIENIPIEHQWYNYYTCLSIGEYDGDFEGRIDKVDLDRNMQKTAEFYKIEDVIKDPSFKKPWKEALYKFGYITKTQLLEDTRTTQIANSRNKGPYKNQAKGKNRFMRKKYSKVAATVKNYNSIDMNKLFKDDILQVDIPVMGETDSYTVTLKMEGVVAEIQRNIKNNKNNLEFKTVVQALTKIFNTVDIYTKCTCLDKNTKLKLLDGTADSIEKIKQRFDTGEKLFVYSVDENGDFKPGEVENVWISGKSTDFIKITLDNGKEIVTTPDHKYMLRDGNYQQADQLAIGQSLMPLYFNKTKNGYETIKLNSTGHYHSTYKLVGQNYFSNEISEKNKQAILDRINGCDKMAYNVAIHHKDFNKSNNNPNNLQIMTGYEHWLYHASIITRLWDDPEFRKANSIRSSAWMTQLNKNPTQAMINKRRSKENIDRLIAHNYDQTWLAEQAIRMSEAIRNYWNSLSPEDRKKKSEAKSAKIKDCWAAGCFNTDKFKAARQNAGIILNSQDVRLNNKLAIQKYWTSLSDEEYAKRQQIARENGRRGALKTKGSCQTDAEKLTHSLAALSQTPEEKAAHSLKIRDTKILKVFYKLIEDKISLTAENYEEYRKLYFPKSPRISVHFSNINEAISYYKLNHKIVKIEHITKDTAEEVYDIKIKDCHNFLVDAGVILHNCNDFKYTFAHWNIVNNVSVDDTAHDPGPGKNIRNANDDKGRGCKHVLLVLANCDWIMKVASTINNYIHYAAVKMQKPFKKVIFPKLYGVTVEDAAEAELVAENDDLETSKDLIDIVNEYGKNRGKYTKGTNRNPINDKRKPADNKKDEKSEDEKTDEKETKK